MMPCAHVSNICVSETEYGVKTRVIDVDFTGGREIYERIGAQLQDLDIGVLVNNVGMSYNFPEFFNVLPDGADLCTRLMHCNILSVTGMTFLVMPKMAEKRKGLILNVSSASAVLPSPLLSMYASTKVRPSFLDNAQPLPLLSLRLPFRLVRPGPAYLFQYLHLS